MFRFVLVLALATLALGAPKKFRRYPLPDGRIVGGNDANIEDLPYQLSLLFWDSHICGASIINENFAVTAAHCTDGSEASDLSVRAGSSILEQGGQVSNVKAIHQNPKYDSWVIDFDVSVLELETPLTLGSGVQPIALADDGSKPADGADAVVSGWGTLNEGDYDLPEQLQVVTVPIVNNEKCQQLYGIYEITDNMICAGLTEGGKDACQGDSGGPLVVDNKLTGIVSWGYGCAEPGYPGVYSSVGALRSYIDEQIGA